MSNSFYSPLRYPGGKTKLKSRMEDILTKNNLRGCSYVEPYCGGAGLALSLLYEGHVDRLILNDLDPDIANFWRISLTQSEEMIRRIEACEVTLKTRQHCQQILKNKNCASISDIDRAFALFFVNRTSNSGIISAGVIGGKKQQGKYKIDARFTKTTLIKRFEKLALFSSKIEFFEKDSIEFLPMVMASDDLDSLFIYLDPPYYKKADKLYMHFYTHDDHVKLESFLANYKHKNICISYDNVEEVKSIFSDWRRFIFNLRYSARVKMEATEIMFHSDNLIIPDSCLA